MKTLPRAVTAHIFTDHAAYATLMKQWSALMNSDRKKELAASHHLLYLALLGKDWRKSFTPPTNRRKLENGGWQAWRLFRALATVHSQWDEEALLASFDGTVTAEMLQKIRSLLPKVSSYTFERSQFGAGAFPFEAYVIRETTPLTTQDQDSPHA